MYKLIDKFFTTSFLRSLKTEEEASQSLSLHPFITVARDPGSGGRPIAERVAKKLNFDFYDDALIEAIAKSSRKRTKIIKQVDEKTRSTIDDVIHNLFNPEYISDTTYINHLTKVVLALAHKGKAVLVGRGSNFIAPYTEGLNVLVTAPKQVRIERAVKYEKISKKVAKRRVEKISEQRKQFVSQYFSKDYTNPKYYDLIINTEYFDIDGASDLIISAFRKKFPTLGEFMKSQIKKTGKLY